MSAKALLEQLGHYQALLLNTIRQLPGKDYRTQYHPDLSPLGWHLGHCLYTETYWVREVVKEEEPISDALKSLYIPELSPKGKRGQALPAKEMLCAWAAAAQAENLALLQDLSHGQSQHKLLEEDYLIRFLLQHYAQHYETAMLILIQRALRKMGDFKVTVPLKATAPTQETVTIDPGEFPIGARMQHAPYDNERPAFSLALDQFFIAKRPVSNGEYFAFMEAEGYGRREHWCDEGWGWRTAAEASHPDHWRRDANGLWYGHDIDGPHELDPASPVYGVNYYEACAFAHWAGASLPHEYQWETASRLGRLQDSGRVWEWCGNPFHPYADFKAYPYAGYSSPYFDNRHYSLRGGSRLTQPTIKRHTFRNYYEGDKRHIHAGIRLLFA